MFIYTHIFPDVSNQTWSFITRQNYDVGKNTLLNRMHILNNMIEKNWLNLSLTTYKVKCKEKFLMADGRR